MRHANMSPVLVWGKRLLGGNATEIHTFAGTLSVCSPKHNHLSKCLSYHYKKDCIRGTVLLCLASPLGQLIDLFSQFAFLSPCLLLSLSCIPVCLASCLLVISLLTKSTIGFQTKEPAPKQVRSLQSLLLFASPLRHKRRLL